MTELGFLVDLLVNHKLQKLTKEAVVARIKEVECRTSSFSQSAASALPRSSLPPPSSLPPHIASQAPSTQAAMLRQMGGDPIAHDIAPTPEPPPVAIIAHTPAAAAALAHRQEMINGAQNGKPPPKNRRF